MRCYACKAKEYCSAAVQPGSFVCMVNLMRYGGTHADDTPLRQYGNFCQYCGNPLKVVGSNRYCDNVLCENRFRSV